MSKNVSLLFCLLGGFLAHAAPGPEARKINDYIEGMAYDPRTLLSVKDGGSTEAVPGKEGKGSSIIICSSAKKDLSRELDSITLLSPSNGVVFPGALLSANRSLAEGRPEPVSLPRGPILLSVDLPNLGNKGSRTVANPTTSSVQAALQGILEEWYKNPANVQAARQSLEVKKAYSAEQVALALGFSAKWGGPNSLKVRSSGQTSTTGSTCMALFKQVYFTASIDIPTDPCLMFDPAVTLDQVRSRISPTRPGAYVKSVDYGRMILIRMDTSTSESEADLESALSFAAGEVPVSVELKAKYARIVSNSTFTVVTLGGNAQAATSVMQGAQKAEDKLFKLIQSSARFNRENPAYPISYSVNFLKDNRLATMNFSTEYTEWNCTEFPSGFVNLKHGGAYTARWNVTWKETDASGKNLVARTYSSGNVTSGWTYTLNLPGDATGIVVRAEAATGLAWSPWQEVFSKQETSPTNKCYKISGTTLNRTWSNDCK